MSILFFNLYFLKIVNIYYSIFLFFVYIFINLIYLYFYKIKYDYFELKYMWKILIIIKDIYYIFNKFIIEFFFIRIIIIIIVCIIFKFVIEFE